MKKYIYTLVIITIFAFSPKVLAGTIMLDDGQSYFAINSSTSLPRKFTWSGNSNGNVTIQLGTNTFGYPYLIIRVCSNNNADGTTFSISNSSYGNNYFVDGVIPVYDSGESCLTGNNNNVDGTFKYLQLSVGKYEIQPSTGYNQYVASYLIYHNNKSWNQYITFYNAMLSDTDLISEQVQQQKSNQAILDSLSSLNSSINSSSQNIINNQNTNTQNIINNQNQNQAQNHQDSVNTQNKIDDLNDSVTDDTVNSNTGKSFFDNFSDNTHGLSGIITAPLNIIRQLINVNPTSCSALSTTYHGKTISMECGKIFWGHTGFNEFNVFYNMVVGGAFCYLIIKDLFLTIEKLKDPDNDKVEVMDL